MMKKDEEVITKQLSWDARKLYAVMAVPSLKNGVRKILKSNKKSYKARVWKTGFF